MFIMFSPQVRIVNIGLLAVSTSIFLFKFVVYTKVCTIKRNVIPYAYTQSVATSLVQNYFKIEQVHTCTD